MRLSGKTALITTSGIGRATAEAFAREGAEVIVSGRDEQRGAEVVAAIIDNGGSARFGCRRPSTSRRCSWRGGHRSPSCSCSATSARRCCTSASSS